MKNKISKVLTLATAVAMPLAGASNAFAQEGKAVTEKTGTVSVTNVDDKDEAKVFAYRIVKPVYSKDNAITGFKPIEKVAIKDVEKPTSEEVQAIASGIIDGTVKAEEIKLTSAGNNTYSSDKANPGLYLVLVKGSNATIYNPALVSLNITDANAGGTLDKEGTTVDMKVNFKYGSEAYAKRSTPTLTKKIVDSSEKNDKGDTVAVGQDIKFEVTTKLPSYKMGEGVAAFTNPQYKITDKLDETFADITNITVLDGDKELVKDTDYKLTQASKQEFEIAFTKEYLLANGGKEIKVHYNTKLNEKASSKELKANKNTATLKYSNDPSDEKSVKEFKEHTYHYSFDFDVTKINDKEEVLKGATFGIFKDANATGEALKTVESGEDGKVLFKGLDEGTYYLRETKAPKGYALNDSIYKVDIVANLNEAGILQDYKLTISGGDLGEGKSVVSTFTHDDAKVDGEGSVTSTPTGDYSEMKIKNVTIGKMPSTGGVGTLMFTGAGVTLFLGSAAAFAKSRKRK